MFLFVVVSRQTKNFILCALCASAVILLKGFLSVSIRVNLWLIASDALRSAANCPLLTASWFRFALLFLLETFQLRFELFTGVQVSAARSKPDIVKR